MERLERQNSESYYNLNERCVQVIGLLKGKTVRNNIDINSALLTDEYLDWDFIKKERNQR